MQKELHWRGCSLMFFDSQIQYGSVNFKATNGRNPDISLINHQADDIQLELFSIFSGNYGTPIKVSIA
ncbi:hypothetical protein [Microbulbifer discodermiae]|uniref:hypothetical protein n=1 Tax=Microbulbifer sp. 2201CG32-9 TaxID=3232309 RepID=UPI00345C59DB